MKIFITGATGYIGGSVAARLIAEGHAVSGLVRSAERAEAARARGISTVPGSLDDGAVLAEAARTAEVVIDDYGALMPELRSLLGG